VQSAESWEPLDANSNLAPYLPTSWETIDEILRLGDFKEQETLLDLGAGDGRVMIRAVQEGAKQAEGFEVSSEVFELGRSHINLAFSSDRELLSRCKLHHRNALEVLDEPLLISKFSLVTLFLVPSGLEKLEPAFFEASKIKNKEPCSSFLTRVVTQGWPFPSFQQHFKKKVVLPGGSSLFLYHL